MNHAEEQAFLDGQRSGMRQMLRFCLRELATPSGSDPVVNAARLQLELDETRAAILSVIREHDEASTVGKEDLYLPDLVRLVDRLIDRPARGVSTEEVDECLYLTSVSFGRVKDPWGGSNKIPAIKALRALTGLGLKEAKEGIEAVERGVPLRIGFVAKTHSAVAEIQAAGVTIEWR